MGRRYYLENKNENIFVKRIMAVGEKLEDALMWAITAKQELSNYGGVLAFEKETLPNSWFFIATFKSQEDAESWESASKKSVAKVTLNEATLVRILFVDVADEREEESESVFITLSLSRYGGMKEQITLSDGRKGVLLMFKGIPQMEAWGKFARVEGA